MNTPTNDAPPARRTIGACALSALLLATNTTASALQPLVPTRSAAKTATVLEHAGGAFRHVIDDLRDFPHYAGAVDARAAVRARAFTLVLPDTGQRLTLDNLDLAEIEDGYILSTPPGAEGPVLDMVIMGSVVRGTLRVGHRDLYVITPLGEGAVAVHRQDPDEGASPYHHRHEHEHRRAPEDPDPTQAPESEGLGSAPGLGVRATTVEPARPKETSAPVIDILFAYNALAGERGGHMPSRIALTVQHMNRFFANSAVAARVRSAGLHRVDYDVRSNHDHYPDALDRIRDPDDGHLDEVHTRRRETGADVVALLLGNSNPGGCGGGRAFILNYRHADRAYWRERLLIPSAFLVADFGAPARCVRLSAMTVAHELGHLFGAWHNPEEYDNLEAVRQRYTPYGFGYCNAEKSWKTIMATNFLPDRTRCFGGGHPDAFSNPDVLFEGEPTGTAHLHDVARLIDEHAPHMAGFLERPTVHSWHLPLLPRANGGALQGFVRLHNPTPEPARVDLYGYDERGRRSGPLRATVLPGHTQGYDAHRLEGEREDATLDGVLHDGQGHWRLLLRSITPIEVRAYTRTASAGFASSMHLRAALVPGSAPRAYDVPFLNPGSNLASRGLLRIGNPSTLPNTVTLKAWDDLGEPGESDVTLTIEPHATVSLSAQDLEAGNPDRFGGRFGDGAGKWRVRVESSDQRALFVLGLVATRDGAVHNVSR